MIISNSMCGAYLVVLEETTNSPKRLCKMDPGAM